MSNRVSRVGRTVKRLLFEAYRRNAMADSHELSKPMTSRWLGLGTAAAYKPVTERCLMVFFDGATPPPRCMGWLALTEAGVALMQQYQGEFEAALKEMNAQGYQGTHAAHYLLMGGLVRS